MTPCKHKLTLTGTYIYFGTMFNESGEEQIEITQSHYHTLYT